MSTPQPAPQIDTETSSALADAAIITDLNLGNDFSEMIMKIKKGGDMDKAQVKEYNMKLGKTLKVQFDDMKRKLEDKLKINDTDSPLIKQAKAKAAEGILDFLKDLFDWLVKALDWVLEKLDQGIKWCYEQVAKFFRGAISFLIN